MNIAVTPDIKQMVGWLSDSSAGILFKSVLALASEEAVNVEELPVEVRLVFKSFSDRMESSRKRSANAKKGRNAQAMVEQCSSDAQAMLKQNEQNADSAQALPKQNGAKTRANTSPSNNTDNLQSLDTKERERREKLKEKTEKAFASPLMQNPDVKTAWDDFVKMRKTIKKPLTDNAMLRAFNKLEEMCKGDTAKAVRILNNTTDHCWQDLYDKREDATAPVKKNSFADFEQRKPGDRDYVDLDELVRKEMG